MSHLKFLTSFLRKSLHARSSEMEAQERLKKDFQASNGSSNNSN